MLLAFDSTQQALRAEMLLEYADIEIDIRPHRKRLQRDAHFLLNSQERSYSSSRDYRVLKMWKLEESILKKKIDMVRW